MREELHLPEGELDALLDGALTEQERARVEKHIAACEECGAELADLRWLRSELRAVGARAPARDAAFEARLRTALDAEDAARERSQRMLASRRRPRTWLLASAAALAAVLLVWLAASPQQVALPDLAVERYFAMRGEPAEQALDAATLERRFRASGVAFRVLDLDMLGFRIVGGSAFEVGATTGVETLYRDARGQSVLCLMLEGDAAALPAGGARFEHEGIVFASFQLGDVNVVVWSEGDVLCMLVAALPREELQALAIAKAMLPS